MSRALWGEIKDEKANECERMVTISAKKAKLEESQSNTALRLDKTKSLTLKIKNPFVTQTIEVMKQTEMLQSLIDTYSGSSNYLLNPCQMVPEVDFPPENAADFVNNEKFNKPIWFIPPLETKFVKGAPKHYSQLNFDACKASLRKAVCGQLRVSGFTDTAESALVLFVDAVEEYIRNFMQHIRVNIERELQPNINLQTLEKAYYTVNNASLVQVHNYWRSLLSRNRSEIAEYKNAFQEYDRLMKESQNMQKEVFQESDFLNILEIKSNEPPTIIQEINTNANAVMNIFESQSSAQ